MTENPTQVPSVTKADVLGHFGKLTGAAASVTVVPPQPATVTCPDGHEGPWEFVEVTRHYWEVAVVGGTVFLSPSPDRVEADEELDGPPVLRCHADTPDGECLHEVPVPQRGAVRVMRA